MAMGQEYLYDFSWVKDDFYIHPNNLDFPFMSPVWFSDAVVVVGLRVGFFLFPE